MVGGQRVRFNYPAHNPPHLANVFEFRATIQRPESKIETFLWPKYKRLEMSKYNKKLK
jgi:hypothetical protein